MAGPPTPPPTTAAEMADDARTSAPVINDPIPPVQPAPAAPIQASQDSYQSLFPTLANSAFQNDYRQVVDIAERGDLKV
jgi:COP9 signalosome complex subunit 8